MLKYVTTSFLAAVVFVATAGIALAAPANCITPDQFIEKQKEHIKVLFKLPDQYLPELEDGINKNLIKNGLPAVKISGFYAAVLSDGFYGVAYFEGSGCLVPKSVLRISPEQFVQILENSLPVLQKLEKLTDG